MVSTIEGLHAHEQAGWLPPDDGSLPGWLADAKAKHAEALAEYERAIAGVVNTSATIEAEARAWRRAVRDAVAAGNEPPQRKHDPEVASASVEVAQEDADFARRELAEVCIEILAAIREHRDEFVEGFYLQSSPELRFAIGRGPDGLDEYERQRRERQAAVAAEPSIVDLSDPEHAAFVGDEEGDVHAAA